MSPLVILPVLLPLVGASATLLLGSWTTVQRAVALLVHSAVLGIAVTLVVLADTAGPLVIEIGDWPAPVGIALVADRLSTLLLAVSATVLLVVLIYSIAQGASDPGGSVGPVFHPAYSVLTAGVCLAYLSGDLFTLFVGFEVLLTASYVLVTLGGTGERVRAGTAYILVSLTGSLLFLITVAAFYAATGTVNLADLARKLDTVPFGLQVTLALLLVVVFGIKSAAVPVHAWLPDSYPAAPTLVTAVFAGLLTKVGIYAMIRTQTLLFPQGPASPVLLGLGIATMLVGLAGALAQTDLNRMFSFALVGHIGYMLFGLGIFTVAGVAAAIFYAVHHIISVTALFLVSGMIERRFGTVLLDRLGGLSRLTPLLAALFAVPAASLSGIPPLAGFVAKLALLQAAVADGDPLVLAGAAVVLLATLLTLIALSRVWTAGFWGRLRSARPDRDREGPGMGWVPSWMTAATATLVGVGLTVAALAGPVQALTQRAAADLLQRDPYLEAVLGER